MSLFPKFRVAADSRRLRTSSRRRSDRMRRRCLLESLESRIVLTTGPLAVSAFPIVGTEGTAIAAAPIATFIDAGGADPIGDYSASHLDHRFGRNDNLGGGRLSITQNGNASPVHRQRPGLHAA